MRWLAISALLILLVAFGALMAGYHPPCSHVDVAMRSIGGRLIVADCHR